MYRIDNVTAALALPTPAAVGPKPNGYFTKGDPAGGVQATIVDDDWANAIQEEIVAVILAAGLTLDKTNRAQLLAAIRSAGVFQTPPQFDNDTSAATTEFVTRHGIQAADEVVLAGATALTAAAAGKTYIGGSVSNFTVTLPLLSLFPKGVRISFLNVNGGVMTLACSGPDTINFGGPAVSSLALNIGDCATLEVSAIGHWYVVNVSEGVGMVWQDVTGSRFAATNYTNSAGYPIDIAVDVVASSASAGSIGLQFVINGANQPSGLSYSAGVGYRHKETITVPSGATYRVNITGSAASAIGMWHERR
jgi:hypothetical protein